MTNVGKVMPQYNIAFATDENYLPYTFVVCQSIIDSISKQYRDISTDDSIIFHILTDKSVDIADLQLKANSFQERNKAIIDNIMVIHNIDVDQFASCNGWGIYASKSIYYRLLLSELLDPSIKEILYLDVDTLVLKDIRALFDNTDLSNHVAAVVLDYSFANEPDDHVKNICKSNDSNNCFNVNLSKYFNSGMLLINLDKWRQYQIGSKCIELIKCNLPFPDQDALNIAIPDPLIIEGKWNFQTTALYAYEYSFVKHRLLSRGSGKDFQEIKNSILERDISSAMDDPAIIHFTVFKPWQNHVNCSFNDVNYICNDYNFELIKKWQEAALKVTEFAGDFNRLKFDQWINASYCINQVKLALNKEVKARRQLRKQFFIALIVLFVIQLCITLLIS